MANPNIVNVTDIRANNSIKLLNSTSAIEIVSNPADSDKIYKINSITVSNKNASSTYTVSLRIYSAASLGGTGYSIVTTLSVPPKSSAVIVDKNTGLYVKENQSIGAQASNSNQLEVTAFWEEIA